MVEELAAPYTAGDPQQNYRWLRCSTHNLANQLRQIGHKLSPPVVGRLLKKLGFRLRLNLKKREASASHPERNAQFEHLVSLRRAFYGRGWPVISCDTKKKELVGNFKNNGQSWGRAPHEVNVHDFPSEGLGRAVPYGIYDLRHQAGTVYVGESADTPEFAVACIARWWETVGQWRYPGAKDLLILVDSGGSNSCRAGWWKYGLQTQLCERYGLRVVVGHYPTGCSKWNPIEHQLFSAISLNWAGQPLSSWEKLLGYIRGTTNKNGLRVSAERLRGTFERGRSLDAAQKTQLRVEPTAGAVGLWNYTLLPNGLAVQTVPLPSKTGA